MEQEYELSFHGCVLIFPAKLHIFTYFFLPEHPLLCRVEYIMTLAVDEDGLKLHVEQKYDGRRWGGVFPSQCVFVRVYVARGYCILYMHITCNKLLFIKLLPCPRHVCSLHSLPYHFQYQYNCLLIFCCLVHLFYSSIRALPVYRSAYTILHHITTTPPRSRRYH